MVLKQDFFFIPFMHLRHACLGEVRAKVAHFALARRHLLCSLTPSAFQASLQLVHKVTERIYHVTLTFPPVCRLRDSHTDSESWKVSFDFTNKQQFFINNKILYKQLYSVFL